MNATMRGLLIFGGLVVFIGICSFLTFSFLPGNNVAVAVPVITVPGEAFNGALPDDPAYGVQNFIGGWTNTFLAMILADLAVLAFAFLAWRASKGWTREVPNRFQSWAELVGNFIYGQTQNFAGQKPLARNWLFPLAATIFVFLLAVNWMKLLPGIESVGVIHCAHAGFTGYPAIKMNDGLYQLYVDSALNSGIGATEETYHACEHYKEHPEERPSTEAKNTMIELLTEEEALLREELAAEGITEAGEIETRVNALRLEVIETAYHEATVPLSAEQLKEGALPYVFAVTPYVRGGSTDLNLTLGLALVAFIAFQVFGVAAQGPAYFMKFINVNALGNMGKKPLGAIDFIVGLIEIISEIGKIISLAFRLFGNMFAGGILLAVMSFLVAFIVPAIFIGLEVIITTIQALVFAILTIVFSAQAMEGHHGDDHDEHHDGGDDGHAAEEPADNLPVNRTAI
jgi:F-type H+-transporting ATPase subunit a